MRTYVDRFIDDSKEALGKELFLDTMFSKEIKNVVICGLGGSGIGGELLMSIASKYMQIPLTIVKNYQLPNFVGENTLAIMVSYSGNTEETLSMLNQAQSKNSFIICMTSGGELLSTAKLKGYPFVLVKKGYPPRAALPYGLPLLFKLFSTLGFIPDMIMDQYKEAIQWLEKQVSTIKQETAVLADKLHNKTVVIYASDTFSGVAVRLRQQINENAKMLCWHHVLPEMNHNELVGWKFENNYTAVVCFRTHDENPQVSKRFSFIKEVIEPLTSSYNSIESDQTNLLSNMLYFILYSDYLSVYMADVRGVNAQEVNVIDRLKNSLVQ